MLAAGSTPAVTVAASTVGETGTGCTLTRTVEFFDEATNTWEEYSVAAVAWATNQQADASFDIQTDAFTTYDPSTGPATTVQARYKTVDPISSSTVYDPFEITIQYECDTGTISLTSDLSTQVYAIGAASTTIAPVYSSSITGCQVDYVLEVYDAATSAWTATLTAYPFLTKGTYDMAVSTSSTAYNPQTDFEVRATYSVPYSDSTTQASVTD